MAKKSSYARHRPNPAQGKSAQQKPQGAATLVRSGAESTPSAANVVEENTTASATPAAKPAASATPAAKPAAPAARPGTAVSTREQNLRMARARATQAARTKNLITPENYAYVLGDLKLIIALAVAGFGVLIALTFVLPH